MARSALVIVSMLAVPATAAAAPPTASSASVPAMPQPAPPTSTTPEPARTLSLREALELARTRAPQVRAALARVAVASAQEDAARVPLRPVLGASVGPSAFASSGSFFVNGIASSSDSQVALWGEVSADLRWTLWDFGRTSHNVGAAERGRVGVERDTQAVVQSALGSAAIAYLAVLGDDGLVLASEETLQKRERQLTSVEALVASGARSDYDLARARLARDAAKTDLLRAEAQRSVDGVTLAAALGLDPNERLAVRATTLPASGDVQNPRAATALAEGRPDVLSARALVEQASEDVSASKAGRAPAITLGAGASARYTVRRTDNEATSDNRGSQWLYTQALLTVPILAPEVGARIRTAEATLDARRSSLEERRAYARAEGASAFVQVQTAEAVLAQAEALAQAAAATLAHAEARYATGFAALYDLLDAQTAEATARSNVVRARTALEVARVRLLLALGQIERLLAR